MTVGSPFRPQISNGRF